MGASEVAVVVSGWLLVPWLIFGAPNFDPLVFLALLVIAAVTGSFVGWLLGQFAGYGSTTRGGAVHSGGRLRIQPGVGDGMGGLESLVDFVRRQAITDIDPDDLDRELASIDDNQPIP